MHTVANSPSQSLAGWLAPEDEAIAARSAARLLITAPHEPEALARRLHTASVRARFAFVRTEAADLPVEPQMLRERCSHLLEVAAGGTMFINDVEQMPALVQNVLVELLAELEFARAPSDAVRVIAGTTVSLMDRIAAGHFSERLFYRLNVIHLLAGWDS